MWAIVEIMGHRVRAGLISDTTIGGATLLRIEHPTLADDSGEEPLTEYYAPSSLFCIRPCSQEIARQVAASSWAAPIARAELAAPLEEFLDDEHDDDDDDT